MSTKVRLKTKEEMEDIFMKYDDRGWLFFKCDNLKGYQCYDPNCLGKIFNVEIRTYKDEPTCYRTLNSSICHIELLHCDVVHDNYVLPERMFEIC